MLHGGTLLLRQYFRTEQAHTPTHAHTHMNTRTHTHTLTHTHTFTHSYDDSVHGAHLKVLAADRQGTATRGFRDRPAAEPQRNDNARDQRRIHDVVQSEISEIEPIAGPVAASGARAGVRGCSCSSVNLNCVQQRIDRKHDTWTPNKREVTNET